MKLSSPSDGGDYNGLPREGQGQYQLFGGKSCMLRLHPYAQSFYGYWT